MQNARGPARSLIAGARWQALRQHCDDASTAECALVALEALCLEEGALQAAAEAGALCTALDAMRTHRAVVGVQARSSSKRTRV